MKKTFTLYVSLFLCSIYATYAQPVLNSNEMLPYGSLMVERSVANFSVIDTTIQGPGSTWNFSAITNNASVQDLNVHIVNPSTTPYAASFTNSNYAYKEITGAVTNYRYFSKTATKMERVGSYVSNVNTYSDPQVEYVFPFQLGTVSYDTWDNTNSSTGGTYDFECIGTGTLTTPGGTFNNALMVRVHMIESFLDFYSYFWYSADNGAILLQYIVGDGLFIAEQARYMSTLTVSVPENDMVSEVLYNNPVLDNFNLSFKSEMTTDYSYSIVNALGQVVMNDEISSIAGNRESLSIDFSNLESGLYYFTLTSLESGQNAKTIKLVKNKI